MSSPSNRKLSVLLWRGSFWGDAPGGASGKARPRPPLQDRDSPGLQLRYLHRTVRSLTEGFVHQGSCTAVPLDEF